MENKESIIGPVLSDKCFFDTLKRDIPEINEAVKLFENGETSSARKAFADYIRSSLNPELFFSNPNKTAKPALTEGLKATAERALRHEMVSCSTPYKFEGKVDWLSNHGILGYKEWTWQLSRHAEITALANAYRACGDERYAEGAVELFDSWVKQALRPEADVSGGATLCWRTIECGIRMGSEWPSIIHSLIHSPSFKDDNIVDWYKSVYEHAVRLRTRYTSGNWLIHELDGLANVSMLYPVFKDAEEWRTFAFNKLIEETKKQIYPDGFQYELATGYHGIVIHHYMSVIDVANTYSIPVPKEFMDAIERMLYVYVELHMSSGQVPDINDGGKENVRKTLARYLQYYPNNEIFKWFATDGKEGIKPDFNSHYMPYSGMATFRTGWEIGGVTGFLDAGPFGAGHQHEDKLNFLIYANGKCVLGEANKYAYDTSAMRAYCLSTRGHNTVRVNGLEQNRRTGYKWQPEWINEPSDIRFEETDSVVYAGGCYKEGYGPEQNRLATHDRTVAFVKTPKVGNPFFAVLDRLTGAQENSYEFIWHYDVKEAAITDSGVTSDEITTFICGDGGEKQIVSGIDDGPRTQGWICRSSAQGSQEAVPTLLYTVNGRDAEVVTVFSLHAGDECPISEIEYDGVILTVSYKNGESELIAL